MPTPRRRTAVRRSTGEPHRSLLLCADRHPRGGRRAVRLAWTARFNLVSTRACFVRVLHATRRRYYVDDSLAAPKGSIRLAQAELVLATDKPQMFGLRVHLDDDGDDDDGDAAGDAAGAAEDALAPSLAASAEDAADDAGGGDGDAGGAASGGGEKKGGGALRSVRKGFAQATGIRGAFSGKALDSSAAGGGGGAAGDAAAPAAGKQPKLWLLRTASEADYARWIRALGGECGLAPADVAQRTADELMNEVTPLVMSCDDLSHQS